MGNVGSTVTNPRLRGAGRQAAGSARAAADSVWVERLARVGLAGRGLVWALIGVLAVRIALGERSGQADQEGAFATLAQNGAGKALLWLVAAGFVGYAVWQATEAGWGHRDAGSDRSRAFGRLESAAQAVLYAGLAVLAARTALGSGGGQGSESVTARLLGTTGGRPLVVAAGLVVIGIAVALTWKGLSTSFEERLDVGRVPPAAREPVRRLGQAGYVSRGVVLALVGALVIGAAATFDPDKARGLDAALTELAGQPYGRYLLLLAAAGLLCFGAYSFVEARYRRL
ncbi:DUF1206 domain-containing protein [Motilibacter aurantiacus]|uniref:DUF1206 domain-containing protein n=1 Tax=Motilibacter aurantiacus TaxID=2714955 RepID=UPI0014076364|nr:DUF1206 domain-containing protein [Motilibacter aurantiacus]NHC44473.1 DUF1206 domain-containing protein [Motilibacter aurantiacus]